MKHDEDFFIQTDYDGCMRKRSCLEATRIVYDNNDIQLKRRNIITVNNVNIALPPTFDDGDFTIEPITVPAPFTVRVELPIAANILWNGRRSLEIQLGLAYFNKTLGMYADKDKWKSKVQGVPQLQAAAIPWQWEEEETDRK